MIPAVFMILRTRTPQPESLTFAKLMTLAKYKAFARMFVLDHGFGHDIGPGYDMAMTMTPP